MKSPVADVAAPAMIRRPQAVRGEGTRHLPVRPRGTVRLPG